METRGITDAFSLNHSLPYSFVGIQSIELASRFNPIYWNTSCLIVNSGATDSENGGQTDYKKIAKAIGDITTRGIKVSLVDINKSDFEFKPSVDENTILYGMKSMLNVGDDLIKIIIENRPYASPKDFYQKVKPNKQAMISLIKGGAFDNMIDRKMCMAWYIWETCDKKKRITLQNLPTLIKLNLLAEDADERRFAKRVYEFNRYLKAECQKKKDFYSLTPRAIDFLVNIQKDDMIKNQLLLNIKEWDKYYQKVMDIFRDWVKENGENILKALNSKIFKIDWEKYALGTLSSWEMESLCFYYHEHELSHLNNKKYGFDLFYSLPEQPMIEKTFTRNGRDINIFKLSRIAGTCISKDKTKGTVTILTLDGVVNVKFRKEYFSLFDKQISIRQADGTKKVMEKSWFNRGSMIVVTGVRSGDDFISKKYASEGGHQLYKIESISDDGDLELRNSRYQGDYEDEV